MCPMKDGTIAVEGIRFGDQTPCRLNLGLTPVKDPDEIFLGRERPVHIPQEAYGFVDVSRFDGVDELFMFAVIAHFPFLNIGTALEVVKPLL